MNILVTNLHSAKNLGDAAILEVTLEGILKVFPDASISLAANDPLSWKPFADENIRILPSICTWVADCIHGDWRRYPLRMPYFLVLLLFSVAANRLFGTQLLFGSQNKRDLLCSYYEADLVLSCGGGNFYAHHSPSPALIWSLLTLLFAAGLRKPIIMLPQSVGPIVGDAQQRFTRFVLRQVDFMMLREQSSIEFVTRRLRLPQQPTLIPDLAFGLKIKEDNPASIKDDPALKIGVTIIDRHAQEKQFNYQEHYEDALVDLLTTFSRSHNASISIFVQCSGPSADQNDTYAAQRIINRLSGIDKVYLFDEFDNPGQLKAAIHEMDIFISSRLHSGIFALSGGIPLLLIGYQPKACGTMELYDLSEYCIQIENITNESLSVIFDELFTHRELISGKIKSKHQDIITQLTDWTSILQV